MPPPAEWTEANSGLLNKIVTKIPLPASKSVDDLGDEDFLTSTAREPSAMPPRPFARSAAWAMTKRLGTAELAINDYHESGPGNKKVKGLHTFCERQGRCMLGCLPNATHSLSKTLLRDYLVDPSKGVTLWPLAEARYIGAAEGGWQVTFCDRNGDDEQEKTVTAPSLFLGAGTLGTNEILLRSKERGLALSAELGQRFSCNGNFAGFCVGTARPVQPTRGPIEHLPRRLSPRRAPLIVEDCAIPPMTASIAGVAVRLLDNWGKRELFKGLMHAAWLTKTLPDLRSFLPLIPDTTDPSDSRTEMEIADVFFFNGMGQDEANGTFTLDDDDELDLHWEKPLAKQPTFTQVEGLIKDLSEAMASEDPDSGYVPMPLWHGLEEGKLSVTHPLGGCRIGPSSAGAWSTTTGASMTAPSPGFDRCLRGPIRRRCCGHPPGQLWLTQR